MPDENAIGPGQSNYQIAGKTRQTVCVINVGTRGSTSVTLGPSCARVGPLYQKPSISPHPLAQRAHQKSPQTLNGTIFEVDSLSALENNYVPKKSFIHDSAVIQLAENKLDSPTRDTLVM